MSGRFVKWAENAVRCPRYGIYIQTFGEEIISYKTEDRRMDEVNIVQQCREYGEWMEFP